MKIFNNGLRLLSISVISAGGFMIQPQTSHAYDMDCKVILCIAGGFPAGCSDAYSYMISRITRWPAPLPPFGFCAMSDGGEYKGHDVDYGFLSGQNAYDCPKDKSLFYQPAVSEDDNSTNEVAFCFSHRTLEPVTSSDDATSYQTVYHNQSPAVPVNFQLKITIEPGTSHEFKSPLYRINTGSGYVSQRPLQ